MNHLVNNIECYIATAHNIVNELPFFFSKENMVCSIHWFYSFMGKTWPFVPLPIVCSICHWICLHCQLYFLIKYKRFGLIAILSINSHLVADWWKNEFSSDSTHSKNLFFKKVLRLFLQKKSQCCCCENGYECKLYILMIVAYTGACWIWFKWINSLRTGTNCTTDILSQKRSWDARK